MDQLINIPSYLSTNIDSGIMPMCNFCDEVACETSSMDCGCSESSCQTTCEGTCQSSCEKSSQGCGQSSTREDPTFSTSQTTSSVTIKVVDPGDYSYFSYSLRDADNNIISAATDYSKTTTKTYSGLDPNTEYIIVVSWSTSTTGMGNYERHYVTTDSLSVEYWSWTISNGSATAAQTKAAYNAITGNGSTSGFSYKVWNDMVEKVVDILHAQGGYFNTSYLSYDETLMTATDKTLTADRFNSLRYNISLNASTGITDRAPGDVVLGSYFITLANCMNDWIDTL